jgi:ABC-type transport system involved in cytochrome bd biosynthesis fused ATPase/permease subunit
VNRPSFATAKIGRVRATDRRLPATWLTEVVANRLSTAVKSELRASVVARVAILGPDGVAVRRAGDLAELVTRGIDSLDEYDSRYLPAGLSELVESLPRGLETPIGEGGIGLSAGIRLSGPNHRTGRPHLPRRRECR